MDILSLIGQIVRDLLIFVGFCFTLLIVLLVVVSRLSPQNPLRLLLKEMCQHVAVTLAAGLVAIPIEPIAGVDVAYDTVVPLALLYFWGKFIWRAIGFFGHRALPPPSTRELPRR